MITCPQCGFEQAESTECLKCGIVFRKFAQHRVPRATPVPLEKTSATHWATRLFLVVKILLPLSVLAWSASLYYKNQLPAPRQISAQIHKSPVQNEVSEAPFDVHKKDMTYHVKPLYEYELHGLVVSEFQANSWNDIYHFRRWKDFLNVKDLCVIWGDNVRNDAYQRMQFDSTTWTCSYYWPDQETGRRFNKESLSNNHLLAADPDLTRRLMAVQTGDQIYLRGYLAEYSHDGGFRRGTSTTREDTGNGACETIFLEALEVIQPAQPLWRRVHRTSRFLMAACLFLGLTLLFLKPAVIFRKRNTGGRL